MPIHSVSRSACHRRTRVRVLHDFFALFYFILLIFLQYPYPFVCFFFPSTLFTLRRVTSHDHVMYIRDSPAATLHLVPRQSCQDTYRSSDTGPPHSSKRIQENSVLVQIWYTVINCWWSVLQDIIPTTYYYINITKIIINTMNER